MATLADLGGDGRILFVYTVQIDGPIYRLDPPGPGLVNGPPTDANGVVITDVPDGVSDVTTTIGDVSGDTFTVSDTSTPGALSGTFTFVSGAATKAIAGNDADDGFIASDSNGNLYFFTETPVGFSNNNQNNRDLELNENTQFICFMAGTQIATSTGAQAVESLSIGDTVLTHDGRAVAVTWIGRQTVRSYFVDETRLPVRIKAHALGDNVPMRDLVVSPDHAIFIDGVLAHAGALVNGSSIVRETNVPDVFTYYHVETADHSLILAENVPAETFVDNVDRAAFDNWDEFQRLYPQGREVAELDYPRAKSARQLPARIVAQLKARAGLIDTVPAKVA